MADPVLHWKARGSGAEVASRKKERASCGGRLEFELERTEGEARQRN